MNKRIIVIILVSFMFAIVIFTGVFIAVLHENQSTRNQAVVTQQNKTNQSEKDKSSKESETVKNEKNKVSMPKNINELAGYLDTVLPADGKGKTKIFSSSSYQNYYSVVCEFETENDSLFKESTIKQIARDFIFKTYDATYTSNLPVISSTIVIKKVDGTMALSVTLGRKVADRSEKDVWRNRNMSQTIFFDWMKKHRNSTDDVAERCTYIGEYSK